MFDSKSKNCNLFRPSHESHFWLHLEVENENMLFPKIFKKYIWKDDPWEVEERFSLPYYPININIIS